MQRIARSRLLGPTLTSFEASAPAVHGIRLLIFDCGGVLRDSSVAMHEGIRLGFEGEGLDYPYEARDMWHLRGIGKFDIAIECIKVLLALALRGESSRLPAIIEDVSAEALLDNIVNSTLHDEHRALAERIRLRYKAFTDSPAAGPLISIFPYVESAIDTFLAKSYLVGLFTNGSRAMIQRDLPFLHKFHSIMTEDDVTEKKPSGEGMLKIMECLECTADETAFVCDAGNDVMAGIQAGVCCIGVLAGMGTLEHLMGYNLRLIVEDIEHLSRLLPPVMRAVTD